MKTVKENKTRQQIMGKREKVSIALQKIEGVLIQLDPIQTIAVLKTLNKKYGYKATLERERSKRYLNKIDLDPKLKAFLLSLRLEDLRQTEVLELCIKKFGKERSPSYSGLNRALPKLLAIRYEDNK